MASTLTADENRSLRETIFRTTENHASPASQPPQVANPLIKRTQVYTLPAGQTNDATIMKAYHLFLIVCGTSVSNNRYEWHNYVATLASVCYPPIRTGILEDPAYEEVILSAQFVLSLAEWFELYQGALSYGDTTEKQEAVKLAEESVPLLDLPVGKLTTDVIFEDVLDPASIYGHFSLVLFLAGKNITDKNRAAITQKRPGAIEGKYFSGKRVACLSGGLSFSMIAHGQIHAAFVTMVHMRRVVFTNVAILTAAPRDTVTEIIATTTRLMRFAGMQQAVIIDEYLSSHEEAFSVPFLVPSIQAYTSSVRNLQAAPAEQRPFYKMIHGDITRTFNRNDILPLLTVALVTARELNPTLVNYEIPSNHQLVMDKYHAVLHALAEE